MQSKDIMLMKKMSSNGTYTSIPPEVKDHIIRLNLTGVQFTYPNHLFK